MHEPATTKRIPNFVEGWTNGKVETITTMGPNGCFNDDRTDLITGLPVSNHDRAISSLLFLPSGELLIAVDGFTNGGIPSHKLGGVGSNPPEGAIVTCPATGTAMTYSMAETPVSSQIESGECTTWATGLRNTYEMEYHTNRNMYATDNGASQGFGAFSTNCGTGSTADYNVNDKLFKVEPGQCHGYANKNRGECIHNDPSCVQPLINNLTPSTNGVLEYSSNTFEGKIKGNLFLSQFAFANPGKVYRVKLAIDGQIEPNGITNNFFGKSGLTLKEGPRGEMVMPRPQQNEVLVL